MQDAKGLSLNHSILTISFLLDPVGISFLLDPLKVSLSKDVRNMSEQG